jgi:uncharacterized membrane protein
MMNNSKRSFIKTTVIGGLVVVVPLSLIVIIFGDLFATVMEIAKPVAKYLPFNELVNTVIVTLLALIGIFFICFLTGLVVRTSWGITGKDWFERRVLNRIPMYNILKNLTHRFVGEEGTQFMPAEIDLYDNGCTILGAIVEELVDGRLAVFVPVTPAATIGQIYLVPQNRIKRLNASLGATINSVTEWGIGTKELFEKQPT